MPAVHPPLPISGVGAALLLGCLAVCIHPLSAQEAPSATPATPAVRPWLRATLATTRLHDRRRTLLGGRAGLALGSDILVGGEGVALVESVPLGRGASGAGFELDLGYGGPIIGYRALRHGPWTATGTLLLGAGHARVADRLVDSNLEADNFLVAVPELTVLWRPVEWMGLSASGSYRVVGGVDDLPEVTAGELNGAGLSLGLHLGH